MLPSIFAPAVLAPQLGAEGLLVTLAHPPVGTPIRCSWQPEHKGRYWDDTNEIWQGEERHRGTFSWGYDLLSPTEAAALAAALQVRPLFLRPFPTLSGGYDDRTFPVRVTSSISGTVDQLMMRLPVQIELETVLVYTKPWGDPILG
jgi:hypothetical protein